MRKHSHTSSVGLCVGNACSVEGPVAALLAVAEEGLDFVHDPAKICAVQVDIYP